MPASRPSATSLLIAAQGTGGASLAQIGETAGYSRGLAAERFGSKQRFLGAVVDHIETWFSRRLAARSAGTRGLAAIEARIAQHLDGAVDATEATRALYHLYTDSLGVAPGLLRRMMALSRAFHAGFAAALADAQATGEIDKHADPAAQSALIVAAVRGIALQFLLDGNEKALRAAEASLVAQLHRALQRTKP